MSESTDVDDYRTLQDDIQHQRLTPTTNPVSQAVTATMTDADGTKKFWP